MAREPQAETDKAKLLLELKERAERAGHEVTRLEALAGASAASVAGLEQRLREMKLDPAAPWPMLARQRKEAEDELRAIEAETAAIRHEMGL